MKVRDQKIITALRSNARYTLTEISKMTKVPISTIFEKLKQMNNKEITKFSTLINFRELGYSGRAFVMIKTDPNKRDLVKSYLTAHAHVNTLFKINAGLDFMMELIFKDILAVEQFIEDLELKFPIQQKQVHYILDEITHEQFMTEEIFNDF